VGIKNFIGTSGYYYEHWKGVFYPEGLASHEFLKYYLQFFDSLELNSTFYHIPKASTITKWQKDLPEGFALSIKANRVMTHIKRLKNIGEDLKKFMAITAPLKEKLGVILFQLPPSLKMDIALLNEFALLLKGYDSKFSIEFRHSSWVTDEVYKILQENNIAFCISDGPGYPYAEILTADFAYIRLHGHEALYSSSYSGSALKGYAEKINKFNAVQVPCYVYFNNDFGGFAVQNALTLKKFLKNYR
jgi:uncharacterized protein YecE (DUF72 family)